MDWQWRFKRLASMSTKGQLTLLVRRWIEESQSDSAQTEN